MIRSVLRDIASGARLLVAGAYAVLSMLVLVGAFLALAYIVVYPDGGDYAARAAIGSVIVLWLCWFVGRR